MHSMTTQSGQARRDLIAMFTEAHRVAREERAKAKELRELIKRAVARGSVDERGDRVRIEMPRQTWEALRESADAQP